MRKRTTSYGSFALPIVLLTTAFALVRLIGLDQMVTTDEPFWLGRSGNFYRALRSGDFSHTYQMAHPGVMTMWAGALAYLLKFPEFASLQQTNLDDVYSIERVLRGYGVDPLKMMVAAKVSKVLFQSVFFAIGMAFLFRLIRPQAAWFTGGLLILSPFLSGFDSILHVDGLFTTICFTAILSTVYASIRSPLYGPLWLGVWWWLPVGALSACAWLTRSTGAVMVGVVGLSLLIALIPMNKAGYRVVGWNTLAALVVRFGVWLTVSLATTFLLLPALWVDPQGVISKLWAWSSNAATEGHENPTFFMGEVHQGNPGWVVYPVVIVWRSTPIEWIGAIGFLLILPWAYRRRLLSRETITLVVVSLVFAFVYMVGMSIGAKKFDRYVLPIFPIIALVAALGIDMLIEWARSHWPRRSAIIRLTMIAFVVSVQGLPMLQVLPYRLDYYNPLLGGPSTARSVLQMGWGQGGREVMELLESSTSEGSTVVVQTSAIPSAMTYFMSDDSSILIESFGMNTPAGWYETDYYVAGIQQTQRNLAPSFLVLRNETPYATVEIGGVPYFTIYTPKLLPLPEHLLSTTGCTAEFGDGIRLMQIIGRDDSIDFYWLSQSEDVERSPATLEVILIGANDDEVRGEVTWMPAKDGIMSKARLELDHELSAPLDQYQITLSVTVDATSLPVVAGTSSQQNDSEFSTNSECYYLASVGAKPTDYHAVTSTDGARNLQQCYLVIRTPASGDGCALNGGRVPQRFIEMDVTKGPSSGLIHFGYGFTVLRVNERNAG